MERLEQQGILIDSSVMIAHLRQRRHAHLTAFKEALQESENVYVSTVSIYEIEMEAIEAGREFRQSSALKIRSVL